MAHLPMLLVTIPLALSAFTHIWNPIGFPNIYIDEDAYLQRAMIVLEGNGPRDTTFQYDHPYFGQLFLAGIFRIIAYPDSFMSAAARGDVHSIEILHMVPRILMGILSVIDTFLVYKISERRYNRSVALIASVLFAVMPMTWLLRRILLDSILLPFLLSSILFATYTKGSKNDNKRIPLIFLSGIFLGLAIFTKIPAFTMIPLVGFLIYTNNERNLKTLGLWLIPIILIPLIWPVHALSLGEFNGWLNGIYYQTHRDPVKEHLHDVGIGSIFDEIIVLFQIDPVLLILGFVGVFFAALKRDLMLLLWVVPFLFFLYREGFVQYFYLIPLLPAFCIATARLIDYLSKRIRIGYKKESVNEILLPFIIVSGIGIFGLVSTTLLITTTLNSSYFEALAFVDKYLSDNSNGYSNNYKNDLTIISDFRYSWIPQHVLHKDYSYKRFWDIDPLKTKKVLLIFQDDFVDTFLTNKFNLGNESITGDAVYSKTFQIAAFKGNSGDVYHHYIYPYDSMRLNALPQKIEIRTNILLLNSFGFVLPISSQKGPKVTEVDHALEIAVPTNQINLPSYWNDSWKNCDHVFKCTINSTNGWKNDASSFQLSTNTTSKNTWSSIYGNEINANPGEQYAVITHMKLNKFARGSHIAIEGYNVTSNKWNQLNIQCPSGTNGPLEWQEFKCTITILKDTSKIRPLLNAGWSSEKGKEAVTLFDGIDVSKIHMKNHTYASAITNNLVYNPDFAYFDDSVRIISLCKLRGDFDVQVDYRLLDWPPTNGVGLSLIAKESAASNETYDNPMKRVERISLGSKMNFATHPTEVYATSFGDGIHTINATRQIDTKDDMLIKTIHDISGKFRMERSGFRMTGYYYDLDRWIPIHSDSSTRPVDVTIILQAGAGEFGFVHQPVKISFLNYLVNKGHFVDCETK